MQLSETEENRALELHNKSIVIDAHADIPFDLVRRPNPHETMKNLHIPNLRTGGVDVELFALTWDGKTYVGELKRALKSLDVVLSEVRANSNDLTIVTKVDDIRRAKRDGKISILLGLEGGKPLEGELVFLRTYYELGLRWLTITWNHRNQLADGVSEPSNSGLSSFGRDVVAEANKLGILLDVSHISESGFWDIIELSKAPVMASHSNATKLCAHPRNITDEQIKALAENGGVMGMNFVGSFLNPKVSSGQMATLDDLIDHIDHITNLVEVDHIGLGPDYMDYIDSLLAGLSGVSAEVLADEWSQNVIGMTTDPTKYPKDLESITKLPLVTRGLVHRGYSDSDIEKILGGNFMCVFEAVIG